MKLMNMMIAALLFCTLSGVVEADAAAKITLTQTVEGVYSLVVDNVAKASTARAFELKITYNAGVLSNPVISNGSFAGKFGAMQVPHNDATSGTLKIAYFTTAENVFFEGSGLLATVSFSKTGTVPPKLPEFKAELVSDAGVYIAIESVVTSLPGTPVKTTPGGGDATDTNNNNPNPVDANPGNMGGLSDRPSVTSGATSGTVTYQNPISGAVQDNSSQGPDSKKESSQEPLHQQEQSGGASVQDAVASVTADTARKPVPKKLSESSAENLQSLESVAERFRVYKGTRTLKGFSELFEVASYKAAGVEQTPAIAVSDGKKMITVRVTLPASSAVPGFSLKGANLKGLRSLSDRLMELDALPQKGKLDVRMAIEIQKAVAEIPLIVVPPVSGGIVGLSDQDLEKLLAKADARNKALIYDLNDDGNQDYLDDYILVAHWLLIKQVEKKVPAAKTVSPR
ncbi:MAG: cohesin domain-containing protein [Deltaproteobacteria bacterium]|nr:cohesin domain-containing protein [Deltaproteobacteria bacterium]